NFERDEVVDEPMEAPFYPATSCFHKRNRILRVIFIRMSAEPQYGEVSVPADEIQPLLQARDFLGQSLGAGLREHAPCLCGSGSKYKRCHGTQVEAFFRR
ncbi:SEC-C metal-binding domain-containing protein, partial [Xanthomonas perforans]